MIRLTILGKLVSMKNRRIPTKANPHVTVVNSACRIFRRDFYAQLPGSARRAIGSLDKPIRAMVTVYYPTMKSDLDFAYLYDLLQVSGVVRNDRYIREKHEVARIDKKNPRVEIVLEEATT